MASKGCKKAATLLIFLNILFFTCVSSHKVVPCPPPPKSLPSPPSVPKNPAKCPKDTLKFGVCGSWLGLIHEVVGTPPSKECCTLIAGLADLEAALCLCTAIKANLLGVIKVKIPVAVTLLINACGKKVPEGFVCA
ncbi:putative lipid-binding protein At4g00165 [Herrania umbratica]|uniref:Lipid-binding protein At4g00165 n=1 Tax=Herrania umbratica TaxID=108875 RepID=A0A6J1A1L3_9ROSI|nr:putative lipid-binding protein At4g00165 [Herrania umbratica]